MLSVIISVGKDDEKGRRKRGFLEELYCIRNQTYRDYEVVLVEQVYEKPLYNDVQVDKYIQIKQPKFFNLSWGRNVGARHAEGDKLLFLDADIIFNQNYFQKVVNFDKEAFSAWSRCYRLTEKGMQEWLRTRSFSNLTREPSFIDAREGAPLTPNIYFTAGFAFCFYRDFFWKKFGGFNENFFGWGGDDNDACLRFSVLFDRNHRGADPYYVLADCTIYHLPHGGRVSGSSVGELWEITKSNPMSVTEKLLKAKLGREEAPTII